MKIIMILMFLLFLSCNKHEKDESFNTITIDPDIYQHYIDLSPILEDSMEIIKLETSTDCLISDITKLEFKDDKIFILDRDGKKMFVFSNKGKYLYNIGELGNGPGEYVDIWDFTFVNGLLYMYDGSTDKYNIYEKNGKFVSYLSNIPLHHAVLSFGNILYFIGNYLGSDLGDYNLYRYDINTKNITTYLPYNKKIREESMMWGLKSQVARSKNKSLFTYPRDNILYEADSNGFYPKYKIVFTKYNIPDEMKDQDGFSLFRYAQKNNLITGLEYFQNSTNYLIGYFFHANQLKYFVFNKITDELKIAGMFTVNNMGGLFISNFIINENNDFIAIIDADSFSEIWEESYHHASFLRNEDKLRIEKLYNSIHLEDNPIIIKFKLK